MRYLAIFCCLLWATESTAGKFFKRNKARSSFATACAGGACIVNSPAAPSATLPGIIIDRWATRGPRPAPGTRIGETVNELGWEVCQPGMVYLREAIYHGDGRAVLVRVPLPSRRTDPIRRVGDEVLISFWNERLEPPVGSLICKRFGSYQNWGYYSPKTQETFEFVATYLGKGRARLTVVNEPFESHPSKVFQTVPAQPVQVLPWPGVPHTAGPMMQAPGPAPEKVKVKVKQ